MNRKQFLRRSILFGLAAAGLPASVRAFPDGKKEDVYKKTVKPVGGGEQVYRISLAEESAMAPEAGDSIRVVFEAAFYSGYSFAADADATVRKGRYTLQRVGTPEKEGGFQTTKWKVLPKVEGTDVLKGRIQKTVVIKLKSKDRLTIVLSDKETMDLEYDDPDESAYDDCFLTTACTAAKGLPDDCRELTALRCLRDMHMKPTVSGAALVAEYYRIAPGIVAEVNARSNRMEIWNLVYEDLVAPVVRLTEAGSMEAAVARYAEYTGWMKEAFRPEVRGI